MDKKYNLSQNHIVVQVKGNIVSDMDGEKVMLSIQNGKYYNLGEVGGAIWDGIKKPISIQNLIASLMEEFEVEQTVCEQQVLSFLHTLAGENLILVQDPIAV